ncbi:hypothetical protein [Kribbella sp. NPDC023855]|uniref:hypothetical protein n=1 Tax=Kribbella sp. NPDC023855 TaxID=3154698 RepID=UPI0033ED3BFA
MKENEMDDVRDLGAQLHRLAATDPLDPIDARALLDRGRRGKRRRKLLSVGGVAVGVAAVAIAASILPNLGTAKDQPGVAGTVTTTGTSTGTGGAAGEAFGPVPGVPRGEAALGKTLPAAEVVRRCTLRYPQYKRPLRHPGGGPTGMTVLYQPQKGDPPMACTIPGGDKPSAALVAAAQREPMPTTAAGQLRNCSVLFWSDLTKWRVTATETAPGIGTSLIALSPSGRTAVACDLSPTLPTDAAPLGSSTGFLTGAMINRTAIDPALSGSLDCATYGKPCKGFTYRGQGRISPQVAKLRIEPANGLGVHEVKVQDGWYAVMWKAKGNSTEWGGKLTAYDAAGKVLKTLPL